MLSRSTAKPPAARGTQPADSPLNIISGWTYNRLCGDPHNRFCESRGLRCPRLLTRPAGHDEGPSESHREALRARYVPDRDLTCPIGTGLPLLTLAGRAGRTALSG